MIFESGNNNYGYETRAILEELRSIKTVLVGNVPSNIKFGQLLHTQESIDKGNSFTDKEIEAYGYNLIAITTDTNANVKDITYKIKDLSGFVSGSEEVSILNKVVGFNSKLLISNATSESGKTIYVDRWLLPPAYLSAFQYNLSSIYFSDNPSDSQASTGNALSTLSHTMLFDESTTNGTYNRARSSWSKQVLGSAARTATTNSDDIDFYNTSAIYIYLSVTNLAGGNLTVSFNALTPEGDYLKTANFGTFTASKIFMVGPGVVGTITGTEGSIEGSSVSPIPRQGRITITPSGSDNNTYSVSILAVTN